MYVVCVNERLGETTAMSGSARGKSGKHTFFCCVLQLQFVFSGAKAPARETPGSERREKTDSHRQWRRRGLLS